MGVVALAVPSQLGAASPSAGDSRRYNGGSVKMHPSSDNMAPALCRLPFSAITGVVETKTEPQPILLREGWHVLHLFYRIDRERWMAASVEAREQSKRAFAEFVERANKEKDTQLFTYAVVGAKADIAFWILTPDLHRLTALQHGLAATFPPNVLPPVYSFFSVTELSEYTMSEEEFSRTLVEQEKLEPGSEKFQARIGEWRARMAKYNKDRLYPALPDKKVLAFYPMS